MYLNDPLSAFCYGKLEMYAFLRRKEIIKVLLLLVSYKYSCLLYNIVKIHSIIKKIMQGNHFFK